MEERKGTLLRGKKATNWRCDNEVGCDWRRSTRTGTSATIALSVEFVCWGWRYGSRLPYITRSLRPRGYHGRWGDKGRTWCIRSHVWLPRQKLSRVCRQKSSPSAKDSYRDLARHRLVHLGWEWFLLGMGERVSRRGPWLPKWRRWRAIQGLTDYVDWRNSWSLDLPNATHSVCWRTCYEEVAQAPHPSHNLPWSFHVQE